MTTAADDRPVGCRFSERLPLYISSLRHAGVAVGGGQQARLVLLLARLEGSRNMPGTVERLAGLVVPVLAGTPFQQRLCHELFLEVFGDPVAPTLPPRLERVDERADVRKHWIRRVFTSGAIAASAIAAIACVIVVAILFVSSLTSRHAPEPPKVDNQPLTRPTQDMPLPDWMRSVHIGELELPEQSPWNRTARWYYTEYDWRKMLVVVLPWLVYAAALAGLAYLTLAHLRRERLRQKLRSLPMTFDGDRPRFGERDLLADLQPLRHLARDQIHEIDPEASAVATAETGGLLVPRWRSRTVPADFVVLIDRRSPRDHLAAYGEAMVETLRRAGLFVELFEFDRTPWTCRRKRSGEIEPLAAVLGGFSDAIMLFFLSAAAEVLDPRTGAPQSWLREILDPNRAFLIVPDPSFGLAFPESGLPRGIAIVEASPAGLRAVATRLTSRTHPHAPRARERALSGLVSRINERRDRWMQSASPLPVEVDALIADLLVTTDRETYRWFAAAAVYPELRWPMTLYLRDHMSERGGRPATLAEDLLDIVQLPWFRHGWMPDWMRLRLLRRQTSAEQRKVRALLVKAMGLAGADRASNVMDISARAEQRDGKRERVRADGILVDYILPNLAARSELFALPEEWARKIARRPVRRLAIAGVLGALLAAAGSLAGLALLPIDECDLWGASPLETDIVGPGYHNDALERSGAVDRVVAACRLAKDRSPDNMRFRYQYVRALGSKASVTVQEVEMIRNTDLDLERKHYAAAINDLGYNYQRGIFNHDPKEAEKYYLEAYKFGARIALYNLIDLYTHSKEFDNKFYRDKIKNLANIYISSGGEYLGTIADFYRNGSFGFEPDEKKYVDLINEGFKRRDHVSARYLGDALRKGVLCPSCKQKEIFYYRKAVEWGGDRMAAVHLGWMYYNGNGINVDIKQALYWSIYSARTGSEAGYKLMYTIVGKANAEQLAPFGLDANVIKQKVQAQADLGDGYAQYNLGLILNGEGKASEARSWFQKSADQGFDQAKDALKDMDTN